MVCLKLSLVALNLTLFSLPLGESLWVLSGDWEMSAAPFLPRLCPLSACKWVSSCAPRVIRRAGLWSLHPPG